VDAEGDVMLGLDEFIEHDEYNLQQIKLGLPHFRELMPQVHALYSRSIDLMLGTTETVFFAENLLLCHKAFLCAAATIGRRHPDDAAPITRRAIEAASLAVAVRADATNFGRWQAYEERLKRWKERDSGKKPKPFYPIIKYPDNPRLASLRGYLGTLSDAFIHFTPEFAAGHDWRKVKRGDGGYLELAYLTVDQRMIEQQLLLLGGIHINILDLFVECFDYAFAKDPEWAAIRLDVEERAKALAQAYGEGAGPQSGEMK
jgi:hypothetical protein